MTTPQTTPELLACPFCHSLEVSVHLPTCTKDTPYNAAHRAFPKARCRSCGASKDGKDWDQTGKSAIEAWNTRAATPRVTAAPVEGVSDEQSVFEQWLDRTRPSGDVEAVQHQWEQSSEYLDFHAATASPQPLAPPPGWKMVPLEPTPEMLEASLRAFEYGWTEPCPEYLESGVVVESGISQEDADFINAENMKEHGKIYQAFLAAAPQPPASVQPLAVGVETEQAKTLTQAAEFLEWYIAFIKESVMSVDIERHPYLPELEDCAEQVRILSISAAAPPLSEAVLSLNSAWNAKEPEDVIAGKLDLCRRLALNAAPPSLPGRGMVPMTEEDEFRGDDASLCRSIDALLSLDAAGALVPHGVGGHARTLLRAARARLPGVAK